jgi:hypothetical protein
MVNINYGHILHTNSFAPVESLISSHFFFVSNDSYLSRLNSDISLLTVGHHFIIKSSFNVHCVLENSERFKIMLNMFVTDTETATIIAIKTLFTERNINNRTVRCCIRSTAYLKNTSPISVFSVTKPNPS